MIYSQLGVSSGAEVKAIRRQICDFWMKHVLNIHQHPSGPNQQPLHPRTEP